MSGPSEQRYHLAGLRVLLEGVANGEVSAQEGLARLRALPFAQPLHQDNDAESEQDPAQQPRHVAGAHAQRGADGIVAREPQPEQRHADEQQARQHVLAREDVPDFSAGRVPLFTECHAVCSASAIYPILYALR